LSKQVQNNKAKKLILKIISLIDKAIAIKNIRLIIKAKMARIGCHVRIMDIDKSSPLGNRNTLSSKTEAIYFVKVSPNVQHFGWLQHCRAWCMVHGACWISPACACMFTYCSFPSVVGEAR
jgi:hypothetical protein